MTRSKLGDLHPSYDPEIDKTFHRLSRSNRSRSVAMHDSVVLDSSIVDNEFIVEFVLEPIFVASYFEKLVLI